MRGLFRAVGGAIIALASCRAADAQPAQSRAAVQGEIEARLGAQVPLGRSEQGQSLSGEVAGAVPVGLGFGARLFNVLYAGVEGAVGPAWMGGSPPNDSPCHREFRRDERCSVVTRRLGMMLGYQHVSSRWEPWARLGLAHERVRFAGHVPVFETDPNASAPGLRALDRVRVARW